jgi:hypothetical protein
MCCSFRKVDRDGHTTSTDLASRCWKGLRIDPGGLLYMTTLDNLNAAVMDMLFNFNLESHPFTLKS